MDFLNTKSVFKWTKDKVSKSDGWDHLNTLHLNIGVQKVGILNVSGF